MLEIDVRNTSPPKFVLELLVGTAALPATAPSTSLQSTLVVPGVVRPSPERTQVEVDLESAETIGGLNRGTTTALAAGMPAPTIADRPTTAAEAAVGIIREMALVADNWDGEGGKAPSPPSVDQAVRFVFLLTDDIPIPEPMLMADGTIGLYWNDEGLYADLEFLGDGRITYYVERGLADKDKGVAPFDGKLLPKKLHALLS